MDGASERLLREFMLVIDTVMNRIPRPVPEGLDGGPWPSVLQELDEWDGALLDVRALHRAYNRLPTDLQPVVASGYRQCLDVLAHQHRTAMGALRARYQAFADVMIATGLTPEQLVPDIHGDSNIQPQRSPFDTDAPSPAPSSADDDAMAGPPLRLVPPIAPIDDDLSGALFGHAARRWMHCTLRAGLVAATLIAVGGIGSVAWQRLYAPPAPPSARLGQPGDRAPSASMSVGAGQPIVPPFADDAGMCVLSPDTDVAITTDSFAITPDRIPVTPTDNAERKPATRTDVIRVRPSRDERARDVEFRDNIVDNLVR